MVGSLLSFFDDQIYVPFLRIPFIKLDTRFRFIEENKYTETKYEPHLNGQLVAYFDSVLSVGLTFKMEMAQLQQEQ